MAAHVLPALYALLLWWGSTGLVLLLVRLPRHSHRATLLGLALLAATAAGTGLSDAYLAFTAGLLVWAWPEIAFLLGYVTGPNRLGCPPGTRGWRRFRLAAGTLMWHELAIVACGLLVLAATWGAANQVGALTFLLLWVLRLSAKLNLFLGVRNLGESFLPAHLAHLLDYLHHRRMNALLPFSLLGGGLLAVWLATHAAAAGSPVDAIGYTMVATLAALGVLEHLLMVAPLPPEMLWGERPVPPRSPAGEPPP